jgi:hypothetical protein
MFAIGAQTMTRPAAMTFATIVAVVGVTLATPASATNGRTAVRMCIDSTASGARCGWAVSDDGSIDICNKNGCITCPSADGECTHAFDGVLAPDIDRGAGSTFVPVGRGYVDDAAATLWLHHAQLVLHAEQRAKHIGVEGGCVSLGGLLGHRAVLGHDKLDTTARYTRVATRMIASIESPLDRPENPARVFYFSVFAAMRRASSRVSSLPVARRPGSSSQYTKASACPLWSRTMKQGEVSSTVPGGGKRRAQFIAGLN